jgi:uncharacterized protein (DUF2249 family)
MTAEPITITAAPTEGALIAGGEEFSDDTVGAGPASVTCACGHEDEEIIVLDSRVIPHAIRHATIFGALGAIRPGISMDLIASHDPLPLLAMLQRMHPDAFVIAYLSNGPEVWTLRLTRVL